MSEIQEIPSQNINAAKVALNKVYHDRMYSKLVDELYGASGFLNFGYWDEETVSAAQASINLMERLLEFLPQRTGKILDVACGVGATSSHLVKYFRPQDVTGIDISDKLLDTCRRKLPDCEFKHMNAENLQFDDHSFDYIICVEAAFHFHTREDFLREARRTLKPGGMLILCDALISSEFKDHRPHYCEENAVTDLTEYEQEYLRSGFSDVRIDDETTACWHKFFWHVVRFTHQKLLDGAITPDELDAYMFRINLLAADLKHYVLVAAKA